MARVRYSSVQPTSPEIEPAYTAPRVLGMISETTRMTKARPPEKTPTQVLPKTFAAWAPARVAPRVLATVLRVRMALIASSTRSRLIFSSAAAPELPRSRWLASTAFRDDSSTASSSEQRKDTLTARPT